MHSKFMILLSEERHQRLMQCAETILQEIAGSFGHVFSLRYEKIGSLSIDSYESELTEETVDACKECQAVFLDNGNAIGSDALMDALDTRLILRYCGVPFGVSSSAFDFWLAKVRSLDSVSLKEAVDQAYHVAEKMVVPVTHIQPNGNSSVLWNKELQAHALLHCATSTSKHTPQSAAYALLKKPESLGVFLTPPYAGTLYMPLAQTLCEAPYAVHEISLGKEHAVYSAVHDCNGNASLSIVGYAMALSSMLRITLQLEREADCMDSALRNVLEYGWRTPDMMPTDESKVITPEEMTDLICEQISLAGQLMQDVGEIIS